jgi:hypothetical protein
VRQQNKPCILFSVVLGRQTSLRNDHETLPYCNRLSHSCVRQLQIKELRTEHGSAESANRSGPTENGTTTGS